MIITSIIIKMDFFIASIFLNGTKLGNILVFWGGGRGFCGGAMGLAYVYGNVEIKLLGGKAD